MVYISKQFSKCPGCPICSTHTSPSNCIETTKNSKNYFGVKFDTLFKTIDNHNILNFLTI